MAILQERAESARDKQFEASINGDISRYQKWIKQVSEKCKDIPEDDNNKPIITTAPPSAPILDPSGYVYEAVPSNRLQGVTATCYYKEMVEDMYGELHENIVLWNAAEYAQENPLFTDEQECMPGTFLKVYGKLNSRKKDIRRPTATGFPYLPHNWMSTLV
ncbi:MAG: hypothetical protein ACLVL2_08980 [Bacteroides cellulosilyticus]